MRGYLERQGNKKPAQGSQEERRPPHDSNPLVVIVRGDRVDQAWRRITWTAVEDESRGAAVPPFGAVRPLAAGSRLISIGKRAIGSEMGVDAPVRHTVPPEDICASLPGLEAFSPRSVDAAFNVQPSQEGAQRSAKTSLLLRQRLPEQIFDPHPGLAHPCLPTGAPAVEQHRLGQAGVVKARIALRPRLAFHL